MIIQRISKTGLPIETSNIFAGTFNVPTLGVYDFGVPANTDQIVIPLDRRFIYLIDMVSFSASIAEGVYLESIATPPQMTFRFTSAPYRIYPFPLPGINYKDGLNWSFFFQTTQANDNLLISMTGILNQVAATVGIPVINCYASFVIYQEENDAAITALRDTASRSVICFNQ